MSTAAILMMLLFIIVIWGRTRSRLDHPDQTSR
ncbi:hypothetical protein FRC0549_00662 [Corynebacterium diphtheriae]|nr:hypothetical protein FRC0549_00662 [Corynebacterium diphtheriae]